MANFSLPQPREYHELEYRADVGPGRCQHPPNLVRGEELRGFLRDLHPSDLGQFDDELVLLAVFQDAGEDLQVSVERDWRDRKLESRGLVGLHAADIYVTDQAVEERLQVDPDDVFALLPGARRQVDRRPLQVLVAEEIERDPFGSEISDLIESVLEFPKAFQRRLLGVPRDLAIFLAAVGNADIPTRFTVSSQLFVYAAHA